MNKAPRFPILLLALTTLFAGSLSAKAALILYSGGTTDAELVAFDANDFSLLSGQVRENLSFGQDFTIDETGRLFGISSGNLVEYDTVSLQPLRSQSLGGGLHGLAASDGFIYLYSGGSSLVNLVKIDAHSFQIVSGTLHGSISPGQDLAFDETGRLFGIAGGHFYEYNPDTLTIIRSTRIEGGVNGLAAGNGVLYTYSGTGQTANLLAFDANTFELLSGNLEGGVTAPMDLAFGELDRLYGILSGTLFEYDPVTLEILNSAAVGGGVNGLAVIPEPSATALFIMAGLGWLLAKRQGLRRRWR